MDVRDRVTSGVHRFLANRNAPSDWTKLRSSPAHMARPISPKRSRRGRKMKKAFIISSCSPSAKIDDDGAAAPACQVEPTTTKNPTTAGKRNSVGHPNH